MTQSVVTLNGSAQRLATVQTLCRRIRIEPLAGNAARFMVGSSLVTNDGSGIGVIKQVAAGIATAGAAQDFFEDKSGAGLNQLDLSEYWVIGTSTQKVLVTYW